MRREAFVPEETVQFERPPRWRRLLKDAVASAICRARPLSYLASPDRRRPLIICYHRVVEHFETAAEVDMPTLLVSSAMFERHVDWIGRHFEFKSLDDIAERIAEDRPFERPAAAITFDDGYRDIFEEAVPILLRKGAPAAMFVVTDQLDRPCGLIHDRLYHVLARAYQRWADPWREFSRLLFDAEVNPAVIEALRPSSRNPYAAVSALLPIVPHAKVSLVMDLIEARVGLHRQAAPPTMTWSMVEDMRQQGFTIGSHTRTHQWLANETSEKSADEIGTSKTILEEHLGEPIRHFAYPGGQFTPRVVEMVSDAGYCFAYTACEHRDARHPLLTIDRLVLWEGSSIGRDGLFSSTILNCQAHGLWPPARRCERVHAA